MGFSTNNLNQNIRQNNFQQGFAMNSFNNNEINEMNINPEDYGF